MNPVEALEKVLSDQLALYEKYAELLNRDRESMMRLRVDDLEQSNKSKNTILLKIQTMDSARQNLVKQIAQKYSMSAETIKIADICTAVGGASSQKLLSVRQRLLDIINSLRDIQDRTQLLATTSLAWINGSLNALRGLLTPSGVYNHSGQVGKPGMFSGRTVEKQA